MRAKTFGAFVIGFALGMVCLAAILWRSGTLRIPSVTAGSRPPAPAASVVPTTPPVETPQPAPPLPPDAGVEASTINMGEGFAWHHLAMPLANVSTESITDTFSDLRGGHKHEALDIPAPRGTPVLAVDEGNVAKLFTSKPGGLTVYQFDDSKTVSYYYAHLDRYAKNLKEGMLLRKGDVLGYVGNTGDAAGGPPHLHFAVTKLGPDKKWWGGTAINPLPLLK